MHGPLWGSVFFQDRRVAGFSKDWDSRWCSQDQSGPGTLKELSDLSQ